MNRNRQRANNDRSGMGVQSILNPTLGYRDELKRAGKPVTNHHAINRKMLIQKQQQNQEKKEQEEKNNNQELFKMSRFQNVESKIAKHIDKQPLQPVMSERKPKKATVQPQKPKQPRKNRIVTKPPVPPTAELPQDIRPVQEPRNYISANAKAVINAMPEQQGQEDAGMVKHDEFGRVPQYLLDRKIELAEQEAKQKKAQEDSLIPVGMKRMEESERLRTLQLLHDSCRKIVGELGRFPLVVETESRRRQKEELERKLKEVEEAVRTFSKPIVFISA
jgi:hypothetical protein